MQRILTLAFAALALAFGGAHAGGLTAETKKLIQDAMSQAEQVTATELKEALEAGEDITLVDVRQKSERPIMGLITEQDLHIPRGYIEIQAYGTIPDRDERLVVYCGKGIRSAFAANTLREMGYTNVKNLEGGIKAWKEAGYETIPVE